MAPNTDRRPTWEELDATYAGVDWETAQVMDRVLAAIASHAATPPAAGLVERVAEGMAAHASSDVLEE
jgi:hypothetical protein